MARRRAPLLQIFLVILLRPPERSRGRDLRRHRPPQFPARLQRRLRLLRRRFLLRRMKENRRPVLRPIVRPLPIHLRRIMHLPERIQQFLVADLLRIESHPHHLGVPRLVRANILVTRIGHMPAAISRLRRNHTRNPLKISLNPPKASRPKRSNLTHLVSSSSAHVTGSNGCQRLVNLVRMSSRWKVARIPTSATLLAPPSWS